VIVVTADHGEELFDHGWIGHASTSRRATLFEEAVRIPWIVRYPPRIPAGRVVRGPAAQVDMMPTILDLAGVPTAGGVQGVQDPRLGPRGSWKGESRLPVLVAGGTIPDHAVFAETTLAGYPSTPEESRVVLRAVRTGPWTLLQTRAPGGVDYALYRRDRDPGETTDLADRLPRRRRAMIRLLADWIDRSLALRVDALRRDRTEPPDLGDGR
jgi:arylsulfatase A-like enzyme